MSWMAYTKKNDLLCHGWLTQSCHGWLTQSFTSSFNQRCESFLTFYFSIVVLDFAGDVVFLKNALF